MDSRWKQIIKISCIILVCRLISVLGVLIASITNQREFKAQAWALTGATLSLQVILILLNWRFKRLTVCHSSLLITSFLISIGISYFQPKTNVMLIQTVVVFEFYLICGMMLNVNWILTSMSIMINLVCGVSFLYIFFSVHDVGAIVLLAATTLFAILALYHSEKMQKNEFLHMKQIELMNQDLKNLLLDFPKPILLLDPSTKEVVLANKEAYRLLSVEEDKDLAAIKARLQE